MGKRTRLRTRCRIFDIFWFALDRQLLGRVWCLFLYNLRMGRTGVRIHTPGIRNQTLYLSTNWELLYCHCYSDLVLQNTFLFIHYYFYYIVNCCMYRAATGGINLMKQWPGDKPAMQNNIWSHELGSSSSPDPMSIVVFSTIGIYGDGESEGGLRI